MFLSLPNCLRRSNHKMKSSTRQKLSVKEEILARRSVSRQFRASVDKTRNSLSLLITVSPRIKSDCFVGYIRELMGGALS